MKKLLTILSVLALVLTLSACKTGEDPDPVVNADPVLAGVEDVNLTVGDTFDELNGVTATDAEDGDITSSINVSGTVNLDVIGTYTLTYTVEDSEGAEVSASRTIVVNDVDVVFPNGFYDYKFADTELRHTFMAAAENYLMHNMYGGVPLFASGSFNLYSSRLQLPVDEYVAVMGYGTGFATMSADDSTVKMDDGEFGNAGEYTYRTTVGANPGTFNQWIYDTSTDSDLMGVYMDALYTYAFNADKTGYEVLPSMAASDPVAVDPEVLDSGKTVSKTWEITLADDLEWYFHPDTDAAFLATNPDTAIEADDFIDTFKLAVDESWFRAISGGGDFLASTSRIKNMQEYIDGTVDWEDVGLSVKDDGNNLTMVFEFDNDMSDWNVRYWLSSFVMTPVNLELYAFLGTGLTGEETNPYGTSEVTIAYHGAFYVDYYENGKVVRMLENPNYHNPNEYFYTGYTFSVITDATTIFNEFIAGKLEATGLPTTEVENYQSDPRLRKVPGPTVYRIMINGLGTVEASREIFPDGSWTPEPLLSNQYFKQAMFFALDRQTLAEDLLKVRTTTMYYFSNAYLVDAELGVPYRETAQGQSVGSDLSQDTFGFNFDAAQSYFKAALDQLIADGAYAAGTEANPTVITIELNNYADSESWDLACGYIKTAFEDAFQDDERHIEVAIEIYTKDFPAIYYDYMMIGEFDLSVGGISGSTLDAASFLDTYSSDNRSGFFLNWGADTAIAEIEVVYDDADGRHREMWSFDAIASALNGEVFLIDGEEADVPAAKDVVGGLNTISFTVSQFNNAAYTDLSYTLKYWELGAGYMPVAGFEDIAITAEDVVITGLNSYVDAVEMDGVTPKYEGDYQVVINYTYASDSTKSGSTASADVYMESLIAVSGDVLDTTAALVFDLYTDDVARTVTSVDVYTAGAMATGVTVDFSDLAAVTLSGLVAETDYLLVITCSDGEVHYELITTDATPAA